MTTEGRTHTTPRWDDRYITWASRFDPLVALTLVVFVPIGLLAAAGLGLAYGVKELLDLAV